MGDVDMNDQTLEAPAVSDALDQLSAPGGSPRGLTEMSRSATPVVGRARTATVVDSDDPNIPGLAEFLDNAQPGDMLVLGWEAERRASVWGGLAATRTAATGCVGLVTDGWIRDVDEVRAMPLLVWAAGSTPRSGKGRLAVVRVGEPAQVGGQCVGHGDLVVADHTGVCVVRSSHETEVRELAIELQDRDEAFRRALLAGADFRGARQTAKTM